MPAIAYRALTALLPLLAGLSDHGCNRVVVALERRQTLAACPKSVAGDERL